MGKTPLLTLVYIKAGAKCPPQFRHGWLMLLDVTGEQYLTPTGGVTSLHVRPTGGPAAALFISLEASGQGCFRVIFSSPAPRRFLAFIIVSITVDSQSLPSGYSCFRVIPSFPRHPPPLARRLFTILTYLVVCTAVDSLAVCLLSSRTSSSAPVAKLERRHGVQQSSVVVLFITVLGRISDFFCGCICAPSVNLASSLICTMVHLPVMASSSLFFLCCLGGEVLSYCRLLLLFVLLKKLSWRISLPSSLPSAFWFFANVNTLLCSVPYLVLDMIFPCKPFFFLSFNTDGNQKFSYA
jgi:hypothetical protein